MRRACYGLDAGYLQYHGEHELRPITYIHPSSVALIEDFDLAGYSPRIYRTNLLSIKRRGSYSDKELVDQLTRIAT